MAASCEYCDWLRRSTHNARALCAHHQGMADAAEGLPRLTARTLYDEFDDLQTRPACPECHRRTRDALQLGAIFAGIMFILGGLIGWGLHGLIMHGGGQ